MGLLERELSALDWPARLTFLVGLPTSVIRNCFFVQSRMKVATCNHEDRLSLSASYDRVLLLISH